MTNPFDILLPYQKKVLQDQSRFILLNWSRQCGKSFTLAAAAVNEAITTPSHLVVILSVGMRQSYELLAKVRNWAKAVCLCSNGLLTFDYNAESVRFNNGSRILVVPASEDTARGYTGSVYFDEAAWVQHNDRVFQAVFPSITNNTSGKNRIILSSTPRTYNDIFGKLWNESNSWSKHRLTLPEAKEQGAKVDPDMIKQTLNDDLIWNVEYLCQFMTDSVGAFDLEAVNSFDQLPQGNRYLGYDVSRSKDDSVIVTMTTSNGNYYVDSIQSLRGLTFSNQYKKLEDTYRSNQCTAGAIDATGIGNQIAEDANLKISSKIIPYRYTQQSKLLLFDRLRSVVGDGKLFVKKELLDQVKQDLSQIERITHNGQFAYVVNRKSDNHADVSNAIALAITSAIENPVSMQTPVAYNRQSAFGTFKSRF